MEQVSAERLVGLAWSDFDKRMLSISALYVLWGGFSSEDELVQRYLAAKGESALLDKRRRLTSEEEERVGNVRSWASEAARYRDWARGDAGEPILRDAVVAYCAAFENALKSVALAFRLAGDKGGDVGSSHFIAPEELRTLRRDVSTGWVKLKAEDFFRQQIVARNPCPDRWPFRDPDPHRPLPNVWATAEHWSVVADAFRLRNSILHSNGYLSQQLEFGEIALHAGQATALNSIVLGRVRAAFRWLLEPINPDQL